MLFFASLSSLFIPKSCTTQGVSNYIIFINQTPGRMLLLVFGCHHFCHIILLTGQVLDTSPLPHSDTTYFSEFLSDSFLIKSKKTFSLNLSHFYLCSDKPVCLPWFFPMQICKIEPSITWVYLWDVPLVCCLNTYLVIKPLRGTVCLGHCWNFSAYLRAWYTVSTQPTLEWK